MPPKEVDAAVLLATTTTAGSSEDDDVASQMAALTRQIQAAVATKAFARAALLQEALDRLQQEQEQQNSTESACSVTNPMGETKLLSSRFALEEEITAAASTIQQAVQSKQFQKAQAWQDYVTCLEEKRLMLPTALELECKIQQATKDLNEAIAGKDFRRAGELQNQLDAWQPQLQRERQFMLPSTQPAPATAATVVVSTPTTPPPAKPSVVSTRSMMMSVSSNIQKTTKKLEESAGRPVYKLRPKKPIVVQPHDSIVHVAQTIAQNRGHHAALIELRNQPGHAGVLTPHHIVNNVLANKNLDCRTVPVSAVMKTKQGVALHDSAGDALSNMLQHQHRYLPVLDDGNPCQLVGILDIGQCLNDAIKKLKAAAKEKGGTNKASVAQDAIQQAAIAQGGAPGGAQASALLALLGPVLQQAFGNSTAPTLRTLLAGNKPATIITPTTSVREATMLMARHDQAALVVDQHGKLVGMVTVQDVMVNAVAKQVSMETTCVESIMTHDPAPVSPNITAVEALQMMQQDQVLSLPVVCEENGTVLGSVDVLDVIYGCGGAEGWRSIFDTSMIADDQSDAASSLSAVSASKTIRSQAIVASRPVHKLRPKRPVVAAPDQSVLAVAQVIAKARGDAALIKLDDQPGFAGVVTPHHVTEKVIAKRLDPSKTSISSVMKTKRAVRMKDSAGDALSNMLENRHRYLPVMDDTTDKLVGILDIGQCLSDAIAKLEQAEEVNSKTAEDVLAQVATANAGPGGHVSKLQALLGPVLQSAFGDSASPHLSRLLGGKASNIVGPDTSVEDAAIIIAQHDKAALVVEDDELLGMVTVKDIMEMAVAKELDPKETTVSTIMTTHPQCVPPGMTALEALQVMHQDRVSSLPIVDENGKVFGSVDVLDLIYGCGGAQGWKAIFDSSLETNDHASDHGSTYSRTTRKSQTQMSPLTTKVPVVDTLQTSTLRSPGMKRSTSIPALVEIPENGFTPAVPPPSPAKLPFKVAYPGNTVRRFRCAPILKTLRENVGDDVQLTFLDEDGDWITITSDECLADAVKQARASGSDVVRLTVKESASKNTWLNSVSNISSKFW